MGNFNAARGINMEDNIMIVNENKTLAILHPLETYYVWITDALLKIKKKHDLDSLDLNNLLDDCSVFMIPYKIGTDEFYAYFHSKIDELVQLDFSRFTKDIDLLTAPIDPELFSQLFHIELLSDIVEFE